MKLPKPPKEVPQDRSLDKLVPSFALKITRLIALMKGAGHDIYIGESFRTKERQLFLEGFGRRYDDGRGIVTKARTPEASWHAYGTAVDIWDRKNPKAPWTPLNPKAFYADLFRFCSQLGLTWGGDWDMDGDLTDQKFPDRPHVQDARHPIAPTAQDRKDYLAGKTAAVWVRYKLT